MKIHIGVDDTQIDISTSLSIEAKKLFNTKAFSMEVDEIFLNSLIKLKQCKIELEKHALSSTLLNNLENELKKITESTRLRTLSIDIAMTPITEINEFQNTMVDFSREVEFKLTPMTEESLLSTIKTDVFKLSSINLALNVSLEYLSKLPRLYSQYSSIVTRLDNISSKIQNPENDDSLSDKLISEQEELSSKLSSLDVEIDKIKKTVFISTSSLERSEKIETCEELESVKAVLSKKYVYKINFFNERAKIDKENAERRKKNLIYALFGILVLTIIYSLSAYKTHLLMREEKEFLKLIQNPLLVNFLGEKEIESLKRTKSKLALKNKIDMYKEERTRPLIKKIQTRIREVKVLFGQFSEDHKAVSISINKDSYDTLRREFGNINLKLVPNKTGIPNDVKFDGTNVFIRDICRLKSLNMNMLVTIDFGLDIEFSFKIEQDLMVFRDNLQTKAVCK